MDARQKIDEENQRLNELRSAGGQAAVDEYYLDKRRVGDENAAQIARRRNKGFTQVYEDGWNRLEGLISTEPQAARLYAFLAKNMGPDATLCASRQTMAEAMNVTERTISRYAKRLEEVGAIIILKLGSANVYCLNPEEVWKSFDNAKPYAAFNTRTLVGKTENPYIKRRLATLLGGKVPEQRDMFDLPIGDNHN